ncbi:MAG: hypothetical protein EB059_08650 [Alphaproteobacteria bacterium]|nr:hypothetical protein [Alphaproteobacteria bacterium]
MHTLGSNEVLDEVQLAIDEHNYGRLYDLGINLVKKAANDSTWLDAVIIITGYLVKSQPHLWDAMELSKRAALQAPDQSALQEKTTQSLLTCIAAFPDVEDRVKASYSVVSIAPKTGKLILICLDVMLKNVSEVKDASTRKQYIKMVISYSPKNSPMIKRAETLMVKTHIEIQETAKQNTKSQSDNSPLLGFVDRHQPNVAELFNKKSKE